MDIKTRSLAAIGAVTLLAFSACESSEVDRASSAQQKSLSVNTPSSGSPERDTIEVRSTASLTRPYFLPTIAEFAEHSLVSGVIEGTVVGTSTEVTSTGSVYTVLTVRTIRGGGLPADSRIRVSELGGIVPLRKVRGTFEGKDWQKPLTEADLNKLVDFGAEDKTHTKPDDRLVMFLSGSDAPYGLLAKLEPNGTSGSYSWPGGRRPKNGWPNTFAADEVDQLFAIKKADLIANG